MSEVEDRAWKSYSDRFRTEVLPKLMDSAVFLSIGTETAEMFDVRQATELGACLYLDKPILLVVPPGRQLNPHLRRCADIVLEDFSPVDPDSQERLVKAMQQLIPQ
jgi:hypothetical protein